MSLQDGRLLAIYARHSSAQTFSYRLSLTANPVTPAAWGPEQTLPATGAGLTYANPYQLAAEAGKVYDFSRDLNFNPTVFTSTDSGATWSTPTLFIKTGTSSIRPYVKYGSDYFDRIDFLYTDGHPRDINNSLYHAYYRAGGLFRSDGSLLKSFGAIPLLHDSGERGTVIYQYNTAETSDFNDHIPSGRAWCWEIVTQTTNGPACVFTVQRDAVMGSDWTGDRIYYFYARWNGTNWQRRFIAQAGRPLYSSEDDYAGGIALDPEDPSVVYISSDAASPFNLTTISNVPLAAHYELFKGVTANGGLSFTWTQITSNSTTDNLRPYVPRNRRGVSALIWFRGSYPTFTSFNTSVVGLFTNSFPRAGLQAYWPLDTANGGTTPDLAVGNNLAVYGSPGISPGTISNAFSLNGSSQYLSIGHNPSGTNGLPLFQPGGVCTIAMWVRGIAQTSNYLFTESSTTNNNPLFVLQTGQSTGANSKLDILLRTSTATLVDHRLTIRPVFDNTWHHLAYVDTAGAVQVYIDGTADTNFSYAPSGLLAVNVTSIGALVRSNVTGFFNGAIDDVLVWQRALTQTEIQSVMANSIPVPVPLPPAIASQSPGSTNALGDYVVFATQVLGDRPFSYQWLSNGVAMSNQTNSLLVAPTDASGSNGFALRVSNLGGSITGAPIPLVILPDPSPNLSAGLISWWPCDSITNDSGAFSSPDLYSRNDLLLQAMVTSNLVAGRFGSALFFDGLQQFGQRTNGFPVYLTTNYTVSFWVNGPPGQFNKQVFAEGGASGSYFLLGTENANPSGGLLDVKISPGMADRTSTRVVFDNTWHHVVWVDENGKAKLYVDGLLDPTDFGYQRGAPLLEATALGALVRATPVNFFSGYIDEVALWTRRLSWTELRQLATNGIPVAPGPLAPTIFSGPIDKTNGVLAGDSVAFTVLASGTSPLHYQWRKDGTNISSQSYPSAVSKTLTLTSVAAADAGPYCVVVTNTAGAVTSSVARLAVVTYTPVTNGVVLRLDFDLTGAPNTQPGFEALSLDFNGAAFNQAVQVTLSPIGAINLSDRQRSAAPMVLNSPPALTEAQIYNDFVFASSAADGTGMNILISRLAPDTRFGLTIWSFDPQSPGGRISDWTATTSGSSIPIVTGYTFNGSVLPTADYDYTFGAVLTSSSTGELQIQGVRHGGSSYGVFVNALQLVANPAIQITAAHPSATDKLRLTAQKQYPGQGISFEQSPDLTPGSWHAATGGVITQNQGLYMITDFPLSAGPVFYRARSTP